MFGAIVLYILCGVAGLAALYLLVMCFLEPDFADISGFFAAILCIISLFLGIGGWSAEQEAKAEYKTYTAEVEVIALECSQGTAIATFASDEHDGWVYIALDEYKELEVGDTITINVNEKIYEGHTHGPKTYKIYRDDEVK